MTFQWQNAVAAAVLSVASAVAQAAAPTPTAAPATATPAATTPGASTPAATTAKVTSCPKGQHLYRGACVKNHKKKKTTAPALAK